MARKKKHKKTTAEIVTGIISQQMGLSKLTVKPESRIVADLGADSLDMVELVLGLESQFNFDIQNDDAEKCITVSDCVHLVDRLLTAPT